MKGRIGAREIWATVGITLIGRLVFMDPITFVSAPGQSAWMLPLIALPIGLLLVALAKQLGVYGGPVQCITRTLGKPVGVLVVLAWSIWLVLMMALSVSKMASMTRYYFFPLTEATQTVTLHVLPMCLIAFGGAVCIARSSRLIWGLPFLAMLVLLLVNLPNLTWSNLSPVLGAGLMETVKNGVLFSATFWTVLGVWFWSRETHMQGPTIKATCWALVFSCVLLSAMMLCMTASMGTSAYQNTVSPLYTIATNMDLGRFLQRLGPLFFFCWVVSTFVSGAFVLQISGQMMAQALGVKDHRPIVAGLSAMILCVAVLMMAGPLSAFSDLLAFTSAAVTPGLLVVVWLVAKIRRLKP